MAPVEVRYRMRPGIFIAASAICAAPPLSVFDGVPEPTGVLADSGDRQGCCAVKTGARGAHVVGTALQAALLCGLEPVCVQHSGRSAGESQLEHMETGISQKKGTSGKEIEGGREGDGGYDNGGLAEASGGMQNVD